MELKHTPVRAANYGIITDSTCSGATCNTKIRKFDATILVGQNIRTLDIPVNDTLVVEVHETFENLRDVHCNKRFGELSETFAYVMQRAVLAEPRRIIRQLRIKTSVN